MVERDKTASLTMPDKKTSIFWCANFNEWRCTGSRTASCSLDTRATRKPYKYNSQSTTNSGALDFDYFSVNGPFDLAQPTTGRLYNLCPTIPPSDGV